MVFSHLGFWSGNLFLIAPFPDFRLLVPFYSSQAQIFACRMYNFSCQILDVVISEGILRKDKICPVFLRPSAICIWRKGALALCTLTLLSKIHLDYEQCSAPYPDNESRMPLTSITETYHQSGQYHFHYAMVNVKPYLI